MHAPTATNRLFNAIIRHPWSVLAIALLLSTIAVVYTATNLKFLTGRDDLMPKHAPFQMDYQAYRAGFGDQEEIAIVVESAEPALTSRFCDRLYARLSQEPRLFVEVLYPGGLPYFRQNGLLFMPLEQLQQLAQTIELAAPVSDGTFTAFYEIRNPAGKVVPIGFLTNIWVKITVGKVASAPGITSTAPANPGATSVPTAGVCIPSQNNSEAGQIIALINAARAENGLSALAQNDKLDSAARGHSDDMACNNLRSHTGSDGSSVGQRVAATGYASSGSEEIIYVSGGAEAAFSWWMNDQIHRDAILQAKHVHIGVGVSNLPGSTYGIYIAVVLASP